MMKLPASSESTFQCWSPAQTLSEFGRSVDILNVHSSSSHAPTPKHQHGWKGIMMACKLYAILTTSPFRLPTNSGAAAVYVRSQIPGQPVNNAPLSRTDRHQLRAFLTAANTTASWCKTLSVRVSRHLAWVLTMPSKCQTIQMFADGMQEWGWSISLIN